MTKRFLPLQSQNKGTKIKKAGSDLRFNKQKRLTMATWEINKNRSREGDEIKFF